MQQISQSEAADEPDRHEEDTTTEGTDREDISGNCLKWLMPPPQNRHDEMISRYSEWCRSCLEIKIWHDTKY